MEESLKAVDPVSLLRELEDLCQNSVVGMERQAETTIEWSGIAYRVGSNLLVSKLGEVVEILEFPELSTIPLTQPWVRGIANVRGNLLPVIDLNGYLDSRVTELTSRTRVLVIDYDGLYSGLVVDEVLGLKHFTDDEYCEDDAGIDTYLQPYLQNGYRRGDQIWAIFSLFKLAEAPQFLQTAV
ncbi:MAG: chemotaxis protein CheW [Gammaproteobacteria bacterium]